MTLNFIINKSKIAGVGVFANSLIPAKTDLFKIGYVERNEVKSAIIGHFINHSYTPNCRVFFDIYNNFYICSGRSILTGEEITINYKSLMQMLWNYFSIRQNYLVFEQSPSIYNELDHAVKNLERYIGGNFNLKY